MRHLTPSHNDNFGISRHEILQKKKKKKKKKKKTSQPAFTCSKSTIEKPE